MESSKVTSKTSILKALILRAWKERWSDLQWGIHIKTILPRGVSGDVYNLADCILQQALVGTGPNQLVMSYLKHSLSAQLVSYAAVLQRIAKYDGFHKPHCVNCLLEFIESIQSGITCLGKPDEGILAIAILSLVHWLLQCYLHGAATADGGVGAGGGGGTTPTPTTIPSTSPHHKEMLVKPASILTHMVDCDFLIAMLYLAKHDDRDLYDDVVKKCHELEDVIAQDPNLATIAPLQDTLSKLCRLEVGPSSLMTVGEVDTTEPLTYCVQGLLAIQVMRNPSIDATQLANQLRLLQRLKGYKMSRLCCEVVRACLMSLNDVLGTNSEESKWGAFTFLKLPQILFALTGTNIVPSPDGDYNDEVVQAVQLLLQFVPLIDLMDAPAPSNYIEALLTELSNLKLLNEKHVSAYTTSRVNTCLARLDINTGGSQNPPILKVIIRAQPTLQRILKTLDADYAKIQDALPNMLCQVLGGKSFEVILSVAAVEGKLKAFVSKLIKVNEWAKGGGACRPVLFDITFLMLCYIVQTNGSQVVLGDDARTEKSFFEHWAEECMIERGLPKCPEKMLTQADPPVVDALLAQLNSPQPDFTAIGMNWDTICMSVAAAMKEVVTSWEQGILSNTDVKRILDNMRQTMCCLPICASVWLCGYMQILPQDSLLKPMNMVQQFLTLIGNEEIPQQDNFKERFSLMAQIIRKMQYDMNVLATSSKLKVSTLSHSIMSREPMSEELCEVWSPVQEKGWLSVSATHALESLFITSGPQWFVSSLVKEIMKLRYKEELEKAVDLVLAVFHLNIEICTEILLTQVIPFYMHNLILNNKLMEPQCSALAKLCAYCIFAAWQSQGAPPPTRKRPYPSDDVEDVGFPCKPSTGETAEPPRAPLLTSIKSLFSNFSLITEQAPYISQQTHFVFRVIQLIVVCGEDRAKPLLQGMPSPLIPSLVRALPDLFTTDLVLRLYDLNTASGRKATASDLCLLRNLSLKPTV